ncbi:MAG TPA: 4-alpha-glucanotransferase [Gammaproteobacteria bacterium]|nr:4-alpha-glucanotransferase [Gammaproteobacteria bacterium]
MLVNSGIASVNRERRAGVLLHPTSLPGPFANGDIGHEAYRFIEYLHSCGFKVWQMLPLGPTHKDKSPYQCLSTHAGNPLLISLDWLEDKGWLDRSGVDGSESDDNYREACLHRAAQHFYQVDNQEWQQGITDFAFQHKRWLDDYALFMALKYQYQNKPWYDWPDPLRHRNQDALEDASTRLKDSVKQTIFEQFIFFIQWQEIRQYASNHNIELFGDMPIFVARDSADVWAERENFLVNIDGEMPFIAGVPPDAFSDTGQRWGNPLYDWNYMKKTEFSWWKDRFDTQLQLFDLLRFDHFRGLQAHWQIPYEDETAINGSWVEVPGREMLGEMFDSFHHLPLVAEDLGVITDQVIELKKSFSLPGMKVLQFAFDGNNANPHLPHHHETDDVVYTGTHDNNTTIGWLLDDHNYNRAYFNGYTGLKNKSEKQGLWAMIRLAMSSVSFLCILPMQDLLMLDSSARMNVPGTTEGNWNWRFEWSQLRPMSKKNISKFMVLYQR